ncbi:2,3-diaminopropionate biosynthesis protein SbnB [Actinoplanes sp. NPDC049548]|uniref:2,3-diaminopropionate biosynthesis protein SbnB n=1 Tax=Actinoplanes sp. NPDC049548 TaxID=3155152 RepID=UPI003438C6FF
MTEPVPAAPFAVVPGSRIRELLAGREKQVISIVSDAYRTHGAGRTVNPPSYFLRFPDRPNARIIALPAALGGPAPRDGIKWISSFPDNVAAGLPRASAVLVLNDHATGRPLACLEGSVISAARTAASAALAAAVLTRDRPRPRRLGIVGAGLIARYVAAFLGADGWSFDEVRVNDLSADHADGLLAYLRRAGRPASPLLRTSSIEDTIRSSDLVVFATVTAEPHVTETEWFAHRPVVLHVSLRDLAPEIVLGAANVVDDVDHCLRAGTSPHLAEQVAGDRSFVTGTLHDVMTGRVRVPPDLPVIFSPFGLGVLDLALGGWVYDELAAHGELTEVADFFVEEPGSWP